MSTPDDSPEASLVSLHDNTITIDDRASKTIQSITYVPNSVVITSGQPYETPPKIEVSDHVFKITLRAGRKKSDAVANSFNSACGGSAKEYAPSGGGDTPDGLNFYFGVTIQFAGGTATVYLAQGSYALTNNWWIGGSPIFSQDTPRLEYRSGANIITDEISGDHDTFALKQTDVRPFSPLTNVFVLMLENHSFDNLLALSGIEGIIAATPADSNSFNGVTYNFKGDAPGTMPTDPGHEFTDVVEQLAGQGAVYVPHGQYPPINNSGFAANYATTTTEGPTPPTQDIGLIMAGFNTEGQLPALYDLAKNFVVCDQWFSSLPGPTWPNRFFLHGASSNGLDHSPSSAEIAEWESVDGFRYPHGSIFDAMNEAGITWRLYHDKNGPVEGTVSQVSAIHNIELWDVHPLTDFVTDVQQSTYPYQYTFIEPNYGDIVSGTYEGGTSQHPMDGVAGGEGLITTVYEAIRNSPLWESSMLIITYDEHGGFYDHFPPGPAPPPDDNSGTKYNKYGFNFTRYGVRVPAVVVSPLTGAGVVDHTIYDHSSVLATLEWLFGLPPLTQRDATAHNLIDLISTTVRKDTPTTLKRSAAPPRSRPPLTPEEAAARELEPVPEESTLMGMLGVVRKADRKLSGGAAAAERFKGIKTRGEARAYIRDVMANVEAVRAARGNK
jgi:phospholipase C